MRIGIDYTSAATQGAGIGRYTRELMRALLATPSPHQYSFFLRQAQTVSTNQHSAITSQQFAVCLSTTNG